jgi:23S rRNA (uracil-5-)-methyltransferase RumA
MEFSFGDEYRDGPLALGMHKRGSFYDVVNVPECRIVDDDFRKILILTLKYFKDRNITYFHKIRHTGYLRHLLVRKAANTGEILIDLVTTTQCSNCKVDFRQGEAVHTYENSSIDEDELLENWKNILVNATYVGQLKGILHTYNDSVADTVKNDVTKVLYGQDYFMEELLGLKFKITPFSFFQTNSLGAEVLYSTARDFILPDISGKRDKVIFDLYSGTGTIAQILSPVAKRVIGVEIVEEAVIAARENAQLNGLDNCEFIAGDVLKVIDEITEKPDYIVLDPPREGINPRALEKIIKYQVPHMLYISCKPTSLARDLVTLQERGYRVDKVCCVDMFPATANVETVCLLSKLNVDQHIEVELDMDELDLTASESKATYLEIQEYVMEKTGLHVSNLNIAQIKRKCGIIERKNYNTPKTDHSRQPNCTPEKEAAIREALQYFKMI